MTAVTALARRASAASLVDPSLLRLVLLVPPSSLPRASLPRLGEDRGALPDAFSCSYDDFSDDAALDLDAGMDEADLVDDIG